MRGLVVAAAMACGLLMAPMSAPPAAAAPVGKIDLQAKATTSGVVQVRRGGGGRGGFRGGGGGFRGGFRGGGRGGFGRGHGGGRKFGRGGGHHWRGHPGHRRHRRGGRFYYYGVPYFPYYYADDYYYSDSGSCEWLRQKALRTGKSYWWKRYDRCING